MSFYKGQPVTVVSSTGSILSVGKVASVGKATVRVDPETERAGELHGRTFGLDGIEGRFRSPTVFRSYGEHGARIRPFEPGDDDKADAHALARRICKVAPKDLAQQVPIDLLRQLASHLTTEDTPS